MDRSANSSGSHQIPRDLLVVLLWALLLRVLNLVQFLGQSPFSDQLISDAYLFHSWATRIVAGDWVGEPRLFSLPPLYPYVLSLIYTVAGPASTIILLLQSVIGIASSALIWRLGAKRFGRWAGLYAGLLFASTGTVLFYETMLLGTTLAVFLTVSALLLIDLWLTETRANALALAGLCLGLLSILRPNFLAMIPVVLGIAFWKKSIGVPRTVLRAGLGFVIVALLPLLLLLVRNGLVAGEWTFLSSHGGINFYMGNHAGAPGWFAPPRHMAASITPQGPEGNLVGPRRLAEEAVGHALSDREVSAYWFQRGGDFIVHHPLDAVRVMGRKIRLFLSGYETPLNYSYEYHRKHSFALNLTFGQLWLIYPAAMVGLLAAYRRKQRVFDLLLFAAGYAASVILFHVSTRYRMPVVPVLCLLGGCCIQYLAQAGRRDRLVVGCVLIVLLGIYRIERDTWSTQMAMDPFNVGTSYLYSGRPDKAIPFLEEARAWGSPVPGLHYNLGLAYASAGLADNAMRAYEAAIRLRPELSQAHTNLANIHFQSGRYTEAERAYRAAIAIDPGALNARAALGWVHFTLDRVDSARVAWKMVLAVDPEHSSAREGMKRLSL